MDIKSRLRKLKEKTLVNSIKEREPEICEHPPSMFEFYKVYPPKRHLDRRMITKGHCNACGFDDYLWSFNALTEEQEARRYELSYLERWEYDVELINAGVLAYAVFPPPPEVQIKFTGQITV